MTMHIKIPVKAKVKSDGSTASYYELPRNAEQLQDLISHRDMNAQIGEIFRECYRYGKSEHSNRLRGAKKIKFYAEAEIKRLNAPRRHVSKMLNITNEHNKDTVIMPKELTVENGARLALAGEFWVDNERIDEDGEHIVKVMIPWSTIKEIYAAAVKELGKQNT